MDFRAALVEFMEEKAKVLGVYGINPEMYFSYGDRLDILRWDSEDAERVWWRLEENIIKHGKYGLYASVCPFCIYYGHDIDSERACINCPYGRRHGICGRVDSSFWVIKAHLISKNISSGEIFSNAWYEVIIREIRAKLERNNKGQFYRNLLINFIELQAKRLNSKYSIDPEKYFNKKDKEDILGWPKEDAKQVWEKIKENKLQVEFEQRTFPFCVRYKLYIKESDMKDTICSEVCSYGKRHGACIDPESDYSSITKYLQEKFNIEALEEAFDPDWRKKLLEILPEITKLELE